MTPATSTVGSSARSRPASTWLRAASTGDDGHSGDGGPAPRSHLNFPAGIALAPDGSLYVADYFHHRVRRVDADGVITTVAGTGEGGFSGDGGPATEAQLWNPNGCGWDEIIR